MALAAERRPVDHANDQDGYGEGDDSQLDERPGTRRLIQRDRRRMPTWNLGEHQRRVVKALPAWIRSAFEEESVNCRLFVEPGQFAAAVAILQLWKARGNAQRVYDQRRIGRLKWLDPKDVVVRNAQVVLRGPDGVRPPDRTTDGHQLAAVLSGLAIELGVGNLSR